MEKEGEVQEEVPKQEEPIQDNPQQEKKEEAQKPGVKEKTSEPIAAEELAAENKKDEQPAELVDTHRKEELEKEEKAKLLAEEIADKKKRASAAQCDDFSGWVKEKCPSCPPIPRMFLYSIPVFISLPLLYRRFFCPPKCLRIGKCSKIYPGCCEPKNLCNKPPCCNQR